MVVSENRKRGWKLYGMHAVCLWDCRLRGVLRDIGIMAAGAYGQIGGNRKTPAKGPTGTGQSGLAVCHMGNHHERLGKRLRLVNLVGVGRKQETKSTPNYDGIFVAGGGQTWTIGGGQSRRRKT